MMKEDNERKLDDENDHFIILYIYSFIHSSYYYYFGTKVNTVKYIQFPATLTIINYDNNDYYNCVCVLSLKR